jgi:hypothetical protein
VAFRPPNISLFSRQALFQGKNQMDISFFIPKPKAEPKAKATRTGLSKQDRVAIATYLKADPAERKALLRADKVKSGHLHTPETRRAWRKAYMRRYRSRKRLETIIL